VFLVQSPS
jgi:hypothetical protein